MRIHPDKTALRAVDACGGTFSRAKNDYDSGRQAGHDEALDAAMEAVKPVDALMTEMLEALLAARDAANAAELSSAYFPRPLIEAVIAKATQ